MHGRLAMLPLAAACASAACFSPFPADDVDDGGTGHDATAHHGGPPPDAVVRADGKHPMDHHATVDSTASDAHASDAAGCDCVPTVAGWSGPIALSIGSPESPPSCGGAYVQTDAGGATLAGDLSSATQGCTSCTCSIATKGECGANVAWNHNACPGSGGCYTQTAALDSSGSVQLDTTSGNCDTNPSDPPSNVVHTFSVLAAYSVNPTCTPNADQAVTGPAPAFRSSALACEPKAPAAAASCGAEAACMPYTAASLCVFQDGTPSCPGAPYSVPMTFFGGLTPASCDCGCAAAPGCELGGTATFFDKDCATPEGSPVSILASPSCYSLPGSSYCATYMPTEWTPTCTGSSTPTPATPTGAMTFCCIPETP